jgi:hypothetical protein
VYGPELVELKK